MKKIAIVLCLLGLLIGTTFVGQAIAQSANPQHGLIAISPHHGTTGTIVTVSGKGWQPGEEVEICIDSTLVSSIYPNTEGKFVQTISISVTSLGLHEIIAVQDGMEGSKKFKVQGTS